MSLSDAVSSGDKRASLTALRDQIARAIDASESGRDIAALSKRLIEVMNEIEALPPEVTDMSSPMAKRRAKRNA